MELTHAQLVLRSRQGDRQAFVAITQAFRPRALQYAQAHVGDPATAQDVVQEAFTDASLKLDQLRDPAAFPGWFRRIVHKHCDRYTRKPIDVAPPTIPGPDVAPETQLQTQQEALWLRQAIEVLPEHERVVMALHYLGDCPQAEVADFLELPLSTIKKRLHVARKRLKLWRDHPVQNAPVRIHADPRVCLFLAIRAGDQLAVTTILSRAPELINAPESWPEADALTGDFPLSHGQPALVLAARRGDAAMVELLLSWGAQVDGRCSCAGSETALWVATRAGEHATVALLVGAGADPNAQNSVGADGAARGRDARQERPGAPTAAQWCRPDDS